jgi:uncharacterized protein (TIGR02231 family)
MRPWIILTFAGFLLGIALSSAQAASSDATVVTLNPYKVVVHQDTAEVFSEGKVTLPIGEHVLEFRNLTTSPSVATPAGLQAEEESLQVLLGDSLFAQRVSWSNEQEFKEGEGLMAVLAQQLDDIQNELKEVISEVMVKDRYLIELDALSSAVSGFRGEKILTETQSALNLITSVYEHRAKVIAEKRQLENRKEKLLLNQTKLTALQKSLTRQIRVARATIRVTEPGEVHVKTSIIIKSASWSPSYDLYIDTVKNQLRIVYNAIVYQYTTLDWKSVQLELCTGSPSRDRHVPQLNPEMVRFYVPAPTRRHADFGTPTASITATRSASMTTPPGGAPSFKEGAWDEEVSEGIVKKMAAPKAGVWTPPSATVMSGLSDVFELAGQHTILAAGAGSRVRIADIVLLANLSYVAVPRHSSQVYLRAEVVNDSPYTLLEAPALLFVDETYIGKSQLPLLGFQSKTTIDLGSDPRLEVKRQLGTREKSITSYMFHANTQKELVSFRIRLSSKKAKSTRGILVKVMDSVPISAEPADKIAVKLLKPFCPEPLTTHREKVKTPSDQQGSNQPEVELHATLRPFPLPNDSNATLSSDGIVTWTRWLEGESAINLDLEYEVTTEEGNRLTPF